MYKKTLIVGCVICFVLGFFVVYIGQTPLNPDVRATVKALQIGMTKEDVLSLVGEPLYAEDSKNHYALEDDFDTADFFDYTGDAASFFADFGWYEFSVRFDSEGKASEVTSRWMDD